MGDFETLEFSRSCEEDFRDLLTSFGIPFATYQRLEFVFRQLLMKCSATQFEFSHDEEQIALHAEHTENLSGLIDQRIALYSQQQGRSYGLGPLKHQVAAGRAKARETYRQALVSFSELSSRGALDSHLEEKWLKELTLSLRFHISKNPVDCETPKEDYTCYLAFAEAVFRPFFEWHFENRQHTSERYHEFLSLKLMMEAGRPCSLENESSSMLSIRQIVHEATRMGVLQERWLNDLVSNQDEKVA